MDSIHELRTIATRIPDGHPCRIAADLLTTALSEGRITDYECARIFNAFTHMEAQLANELRDHHQTMDNLIKAHQQTNEAQYCANQAIAWLNDPLVKPVFVLSVWIEVGLNWLFRRKEAA